MNNRLAAFGGTRRATVLALAVLATVGEALLFTWSRGWPDWYFAPVLLLECGLTAAAAAAWLAPPSPRPLTALPLATGKAGWATWRGWQKAIVVVVVLAGIGLCVNEMRRIVERFPVNLAYSDIIPALSIYPRRFMAGETVYTPFTDELGYPALPTYLPATWGPFLVAEWLKFDYRWLAFGLLLGAGFGAYGWVVLRLRRPLLVTALLLAWPFALLHSVMRTDFAIFAFSVEMLPAGYYLVLAAGILLPSRGLRVAGLLLCLLSRYSLVFWVPLYMALLYFRHSHREAWLTAALVATGVLGLYVIPFLSHDWGMFMRVQEAYVNVALRSEWLHLNTEGMPIHLYNGIGLANFFYYFGSGDLLHRVQLLQRVHLAVLVLTAAGAAAYYWYRPATARLDYRIYAVLVLKVYLAFFYAFILVPYAYLALVSLLVSLFVLLIAVGGTRQLAVPGEADSILV